MQQGSDDLERVRRLVTLTLAGKVHWERESESDGYVLGTETLSAVLDRDPKASDIRLRIADKFRDKFEVIVRQDLSVSEGLVEERLVPSCKNSLRALMSTEPQALRRTGTAAEA